MRILLLSHYHPPEGEFLIASAEMPGLARGPNTVVETASKMRKEHHPHLTTRVSGAEA